MGIYSFGIGTEWVFEDWAGHVLGCEVHAMDPTEQFRESHEEHTAENVQFHYWGLKGKNERLTHNYGHLGGEMLNLADMWAKLGHKEAKRPIDLIKIDCEGCEWESFVYMAQHEPEVFTNVRSIIIEVHVTKSLRVHTEEDLRTVEKFWELLLDKYGFRLWYFHENPGAHFDREVHPVLLDLGLKPNVCCYELAFFRDLR